MYGVNYAWVLDARPTNGGVEVLSVGDDGALNRSLVRTTFPLYILPKEVDPNRLAEDMMNYPGVVRAVTQDWFIPPWYSTKATVVKAEVADLRTWHVIRRRTEALNIGDVVNTYPHPLTQALLDAGMNPCSLIDLDTLRTVEDLNDPTYPTPTLNVLELILEDWAGPIDCSEGIPDRFVLRFNGEVIEEGPLRDLSGYADMFRKAHVLTYSGDLRVITEIVPEAKDVPVKVKATNNLVGIHGLIEWCRISWVPLSDVEGSPIGKVLTTVEGLEALRRRYLIPERPARAEVLRPLNELASVDRGGLVLTPEPGVYFNVAQLDFNSLYPTIIAKHNISPETVNRPRCRRYFTVPEVGHRVCLDKEGLVASVLNKLVKRRATIKEAMKHLPKNSRLRNVLDERQSALKWVMVASFGYLGYRNSRFGRIDAYESVTALARHIANLAITIAESLGFKVIHVLVDSVFVTKDGATEDDYVELAKAIEAATGIRMKLEAVYDWVVFPPTREGAGAPNKYFGRLRNGEIKAKGVWSISKTYPRIVRMAAEDAVRVLARARTPKEFAVALRDAVNAIQNWARKVMENDVLPELLVIERKLRKVPLDSTRPHVRAARTVNASPGTIVRYVMAATPYSVAVGFHGYSRAYYARKLANLAESFKKLEQYLLNN